jgi:hypothetical protein
MNHTRIAALALAGTAAITTLLAGCVEGTSPGTPGAQPEPPTSGSTAEQAAEQADEPAGEFTAQGTELGLGEKAVVPFKSNGKKGSVGVTVTKIEKGKPADLKPLELGAQAEGMVPFYIRITVSNESGTDFSFTSLGSLEGLLDDGSPAQGVSVIGSFDKCDRGDAGEDFTTKGATYEACALALAPTGKVTGAVYTDGEYSDQAPNTDYGAEPITWQK